jgi:hypothetical protein
MSASTFLRRLCMAASVALPASLLAQANGIHAVLPEFNSVFKGYSAFKPCMGGIGYQHQTKPGVTFGVDATFVLFSLPDEETSLVIEGQGNERAYFESVMRSWGITYRSVYHLNGNGEGFYVGSFLGLRKATQHLTLEDYFNDHYGADPYPHRAKAEAFVFPIGVRLGLSSALDGWYQDLYFQLGYQLGKHEMDMGHAKLDGVGLPLRGLTYTLGYAWGIGW